MLENLVAWCAVARASLASAHPLLPWLALVGLVWSIVYIVRRWLPALWVPLTRWPSPESPASHVLQGLPSVLLGAALGAIATPDGDASAAVYGALAGALAPLWHHALRALPGPYQGALRDAARRAADRLRGVGRASLLIGALLFSGCAVPLGTAQRDASLLGAPQSASERCSSIDEARTVWGAVAKGAAILGGASGVSAIPLGDDRDAQIAVGITAAGAAVISAVAIYVAEQKGEAWARECSQ